MKFGRLSSTQDASRRFPPYQKYHHEDDELHEGLLRDPRTGNRQAPAPCTSCQWSSPPKIPAATGAGTAQNWRGCRAVGPSIACTRSRLAAPLKPLSPDWILVGWHPFTTQCSIAINLAGPANVDQNSTSPYAVIAAIRAIVPACIGLAGGPIGDATISAFPEENVAVERAIEKRRREFFTGRQYARSALSQLGFPPASIPVLPSRAPEWPQGFIGSISHSGDICVALVAAESDFIGIGIDIEISRPLEAELYATIFRSSELSMTGSVTRCIDQAKLLFVVKEAFFKLYHPLTGYFLDFLEVSVRLDLVGGTFVLELLEGPPTMLGKRKFEGVWGHSGNYCFAFVSL